MEAIIGSVTVKNQHGISLTNEPIDRCFRPHWGSSLTVAFVNKLEILGVGLSGKIGTAIQALAL